VKNVFPLVVALSLLAMLVGCGKSAEQQEQARFAREAAVQKAIADSLAEEREKDQRMRERAAAEASARIERDNAARDAGLAKAAAADAASAKLRTEAEQKLAADTSAILQYLDRLRQYARDPDSLQTRNVQLAPKRNGLCAEFNVKDKSGRYAGFKRVVVTDARVAPEEPPTREMLTQFLVFQIAARDTGCFPDVQQLKMLQ
jgi:hypothetical protein